MQNYKKPGLNACTVHTLPLIASRLVTNFARALFFVFAATVAIHTHADEFTDGSIDLRPSLLEDEWYSEGWDQIFYFEDGSLMVAQMTILNLGFGSHHAGVFTMLVPPGGAKTIIKQSRSNRDWEFADNTLDIQIANHRLHGSSADYRVLIRQSKGEAEVDFNATAEPWLLGKSLEVGEAYQYVSFYAPMLEARGRYRLRVKGEPDFPGWQSLEGGRGFAVRYVNSIGLHKLIRSSSRIVDIDVSEMSPILYISVDKNGGQQANLALYKEGRLLHEAREIELQWENRVEDSDNDKRDVPDNYSIDVSKEEFSLKGTIKIEEFLARVDPVDSLKPFVRTIVKFLNTPIQYRFLANYDLEYQSKGQQMRLQGRALIDHMVLRHETRGQQNNGKNRR